MIQQELAGMAAAFAFLIFAPRLLKKARLWHGFYLFMTALIIGLLSGHGAARMWHNFISVPTSPKTVKTISVVIQIGILSTLMKHYGVLDRLVGGFRSVFVSAKTVMALLPAAFGMLTVPGGAQLSAPFIHELGDQLHMPAEHQAAVNLVFRHLYFFFLPTGSSILILSAMAPHISIYRLFAMTAPFALCFALTGWFLYLRPVETVRLPRSGSRLEGLKDLLKYMSPIYMIILLNACFRIELCSCAALSLLFILAVWGRGDVKGYFRVFWKGVSWKTLVMMVAIYFMQNTIKDLSGLMGAFKDLFMSASGWSVLPVIAAAALFFGMSTGLSYVPVGILVPLLTGLALPAEQELIYCAFIYIWSFLGYFYSPLHLCQVVTLEHMHCPIMKLDRVYLPLFVESALSSFVLFFVYQLAF